MPPTWKSTLLAAGKMRWSRVGAGARINSLRCDAFDARTRSIRRREFRSHPVSPDRVNA
jgi:hypothetical protein